MPTWRRSAMVATTWPMLIVLQPSLAQDPPPGESPEPASCAPSTALTGIIDVVGAESAVEILPTTIPHDQVVVRYTAWVDGVATRWSEEVEPWNEAAPPAAETRGVVHPLDVADGTPAMLAATATFYRDGRPVAMAVGTPTRVDLDASGDFAATAADEHGEAIVDGEVVQTVIAGLATTSLPRVEPEAGTPYVDPPSGSEPNNPDNEDPTGYELSDVDCAPDYLTSWRMTSAEYQSAATWEGLATYYAATTWSDSTEDDCELNYGWDIDWDGDDFDNDSFDDVSSKPWSCAAAPEFNPGFSIPAADLYSYLCTTHNPTATNRATVLDWTRFLRDLDRYGTMDTTHIYDIYGEAEAHTWDWDGPFSADYPQQRMEDAADTLGWDWAWTESSNWGQVPNGTWR